MSNKKNNDFELEIGTGTLHQSAPNKDAKENSPTHYGAFNLEGTLLDISGWKKTTPNGSYITLSLENSALSQEENAEIREVSKKEYAKEKKDNPDEFILMNGAGTMHHQNDEDKKEDFFASIRYEGVIYQLTGTISKSKKDVPFLWLNISEGKLSKEERTELAKTFA